jgi:hypothetical protein
MSSNINVIIISKVGPDNTEWIDTVKGYDLATSSPSNTTVIYPTSNLPETKALIDANALNLTDDTWYNLIIYEWANCPLPTNADIKSIIDNILVDIVDVYLLIYLMYTC